MQFYESGTIVQLIDMRIVELLDWFNGFYVAVNLKTGENVTVLPCDVVKVLN